MAKSPSIKREKWIRLSLTWLIVILVSVVIIYPLVWTVGASLNAGNSLLSTSIIPENLSFQHYADLFNGPQGDIFTDAQREDLIQRMGVACARPAQAVIEIGMKAMKKWLELRKNE